MRYLFDEYAFDTDRREIHRGADVVSVTPQVFDLLDYLIRNRERVVSKDDLINAIWNGRSVSDTALTTRLNAARTAIGDSGEQQRLIKTLPRKGFRFVGVVRQPSQPSVVADTGGRVELSSVVLALPEKPSIAVLPFQSLSTDPEQEYFADGVVEEIITALSRFKTLFVIARNSSFMYKRRAADPKQVGHELGVQYVLEGSVRKSANRVRITGQLVDTTIGTHIWADRFDGALEDIFDLQDQLSAMIVGAISPKLEQAEIERARRKPTESLHAYDYYLRGMASFHHGSRKALAQALELFKKAIQLDPGFASAYAMAAWCCSLPLSFGTAGREELREAERLARLAARLGTDDAIALCVAGFVIADIARDYDTGIAMVSRALVLNPNLVTAWFLGGWVRVINGDPDAAIEHFARAERFSPFDPFIWAVHAGIANAHFFAGRDNQALSAAEHCLRDMPKYVPALRIVAASSALTGATDRARIAIARIRELNPGYCISGIKERIPCRRSEQIARMMEGLRKAGLPE